MILICLVGSRVVFVTTGHRLKVRVDDCHVWVLLVVVTHVDWFYGFGAQAWTTISNHHGAHLTTSLS
jgi:hypothetical protein